ncbi:MAG: putative ATP-grasp-modified RiPP [Pseudonocardiaceae bacterium]
MMTAQVESLPADTAEVFPAQDHFPLGRPFGVVEDVPPEPPSAVRPFGLTLAVEPRHVEQLDVARFGYDEDAQVGVVYEGDRVVRLAKHTDGKTGTVTDKGDGQHTNKDSDTDHGED